MATYRVDTVPRLLKPVYVPMTWIVGVVLFCYYALCRMTSRVSIDGPGNHDLAQHAIFCFWHESWLSYCVVFNRYPSPHTMISHPAAYMRPIHIQFRLMGLTPLVLGSSGEEGRRAADAVAALVGRGLSTSISPDGPYGPPRVLKKGVLHIARKSGVPIVPLTIRASRGLRLPSWDAKQLPLPFSRIAVTVHEPFVVTEENFNCAAVHVIRALDGPAPSTVVTHLHPASS